MCPEPPEFGQNASMSVAILMGSSSDASVMDDAVQILRSFDVPVEIRVLSAHRTPDDTVAFARGGRRRGVKVIIAAAGGAAHLAGVVAATTPLPVIGVPIALANLRRSRLAAGHGADAEGHPGGHGRHQRGPQRRAAGHPDHGPVRPPPGHELDRFIANMAEQVRDMDAEVDGQYARPGLDGRCGRADHARDPPPATLDMRPGPGLY